MRISKPPDGMLLSTEGLTKLYEVHPIYFWASVNRKLVPDLRYLPRSLDQAKRPTEVVNWLLAGPSKWLQPAVVPMPGTIELKGSVTSIGQRADSPLVVNLTAKAASELDYLPALMTQVRWSLR